MKKVWQICSLSDDIKSGPLDLSKFTIDFFSVLQGNNFDNIYTQADNFLKKTFLTNNMRYIITQILRRLTSGEGNPNLILSTRIWRRKNPYNPFSLSCIEK